jgi:hypothetical protein
MKADHNGLGAATGNVMGGFGSFDPLFGARPGSVPGYLMLLGVREDTSVAINEIRAAISSNDEGIEQQIEQMLGDLNWRPQLVAATAILVGELSQLLPALWSALGRPCWTSPQLAAVASKIDTDFISKAKTRLEDGCKMNVREAAAMSPIARHSALGPASVAAHSPKLMSALVSLCSMDAAAEDWLPELISRPDAKEVLERDKDHAGAIAVRWRAGMDELLGRLGPVNGS